MAETVGRPIYVLEEEMPLSELLEWRAYFHLKNEAEKRAVEEAKRKAKLNKRGR